MAVLHKEFTGFNTKIKLNDSRIESLKTSRKNIKKQIRQWFKDNKPDELQPKFKGQGSFEMHTTINPISVMENGVEVFKYDLDYGVYFIEDGDDNRQDAQTWHDWIYESVETYTSKDPVRKNSCIRVIFADGHHIDLPIYYKNGDTPELAHLKSGYIESDPKAFYEWFNAKKTKQLERIVRYLKAWKNFKECNNSNLSLPSGFELTILATNHFKANDNDDVAFRETVRAIEAELKSDWKCLRPTTPKGEDVFADYCYVRKTDFLNALKDLVSDCDRAKDEKNFKKASEILIDNQFGGRFPKGEDKDEEQKNAALERSLAGAAIAPKPYGYKKAD